MTWQLLGTLAVLAVLAPPASAIQILPDAPHFPADNPQTPAKVELGRKLFHDPRLSVTNTVSCNTCHNIIQTREHPRAAGTDGLQFSDGINGLKGGRNAPTVWNSAYRTALFWDGRARSLEEQAKGPIVNPVEMGLPNHEVVVAKLKTIPGYVKEFREVFGTNDFTIDHVAKAIAAFERTLLTPNAPFDRYRRGEKTALSETAERGWEKFQKFGCVACHGDVTFAGREPQGSAFFMKFPAIEATPSEATNPEDFRVKYKFKDDSGRFQVTRLEKDRNRWRVPSLRNVELTAPYFHNGAVKTLNEAVRVMARVQLGRVLTDDDAADLEAFLKSLTGEQPRQTEPVLPR